MTCWSSWGPLGPGVLGSVEAGGDSFAVELLREGSGAGVLSWVGGCECMRGLGCGCSWEGPGGDQREMPTEDTERAGMSSARFPKPSRDRSATWRWHRGSGCLGEPAAPQQGKTSSSQRPGRSPGGLQARREHFPCSAPFEPRQVWPWSSGVVPEPSP